MVEVPGKTLEWLLAADNPAIRYLALRELFERPDTDGEVARAKLAIPGSPWIRRLLESQHPDGYWTNPRSCYLPKFRATVWHLQLLAELGMPGDDPRVRRAGERFLAQHTMRDGGFTCGSPAHRRRFSEECVTGHMTYTLLQFGWAQDPRVQGAVAWLLYRQLPDGGWNCDHRPAVRHSSFISTLAALKGLAVVPAAWRDGRYEAAVARGVEFLLAHQLFWSDRTGRPVMKKAPLRLHFPAHYAYDLLQTPRVLSWLGVGQDPRLTRALDLLEAARDAEGRWRVDCVPRPPSGDEAMVIRIEPEGEPSKWLTVNVLLVLKRFGRVRPSLP